MTPACGGLAPHLPAQNKKAWYARIHKNPEKTKKAVRAVKKKQKTKIIYEKRIDKAKVNVYNKAMKNAGGQLVDGGLAAAKASS